MSAPRADRSLLLFVDLMKTEGARFSLGALALLASQLLACTLPWFLRGAIQILERGGEGAKAWDALRGQALLLMGVALAMAVTRTASRIGILGAGRIVGDRLRRRAMARLVTLAPSFYARHTTGDLVSRLASDCSVCQSVCGPGILYALQAIFLYAGSLAFMILLDGRLTGIVLLPFPLLLGAVIWAANRVKSHSAEAQIATGQLSSETQESLAGIAVVRAFVMEERQSRRFAEVNARLLRHNLAQTLYRGLIAVAIGVATGLSSLFVLWVGGRAVAEGRLGYGDFVAFFAYMGLLVQPTVYVGWVAGLMARGGPAIERVRAIIEAEAVTVDPPGAHRGAVQGRVAIRALSFRYASSDLEERRPALVDVSLEVPRGAILGLFGSVGSGKSTLLRAIPRLLETPPATIFVDDVPIERWSLGDLRSGIGAVPQDGALFSLTLAENIALGRPAASREEILRATIIAGLQQDLAQLPQGLDTLIGERGIMLSGGQRQRAAIARALLVDPRILLLDDALSMVDAETAAKILANLRLSSAAMTVLVASHRTAPLLAADELIVLERGAIVERGAPSQLLAQGGIFARAHEAQQLSEELERA